MASAATPSTASDRIELDRLGPLLGSSPFRSKVLHYESVGSTNDVAREHARQGAADRTVVVAEEQRAGRGRRSRTWDSPAGGGLYVSIVLRPGEIDHHYATGVQLAAGVAVVETVASLLPGRPELLWPNDVFCRGRKLAGVLVEGETSSTELDFLVCGIGVNVNQAGTDFTQEVAAVAGSLRQLRGGPVDRTALLAELLVAFEAWEGTARTGGLSSVIARWQQWSPSALGEEVDIETVGGLVRGRAAGLSASGGLLVDVDGKVREILVGELVRVRRRS